MVINECTYLMMHAGLARDGANGVGELGNGRRDTGHGGWFRGGGVELS